MKKKLFAIIIAITASISVWLYGTLEQVAQSQGEIEVECGQIREREFTGDMQEHNYVITMDPRWRFDVSVDPVGERLNTVIVLYGPTGIILDYTDDEGPISWAGLVKSPSIDSGVLSARGRYRIRVANAPIQYDKLQGQKDYFGGVGLYELSVGCTTRDGERIGPGDNLLPAPTATPLPTATPRSALPENAPTFEGIGFPGLAPVDMSAIARVPLPVEAATYGVAPLDNQIYGFVVDAEAGDTLDLSYARSSGNMNLGLALLSDSNEIFFQASLVTSESLSTRLTLPETGQYTIGVFRISLVEPTELETTLFEIRGALNPIE